MGKRMFGAVLGGAALLGGLLAAAPAASANPNWQLWNVTTNSAVGPTTPPTVLHGSGTLDFVATINGNSTTIECQGAKLFAHTFISTDQYTAVPGADLSYPVTPPTVLSSWTLGDPNYDVCENITGTTFGNGVPIDFTTLGAAMTLSFTTPYPGVSGVYTGTMATQLIVPTDEFMFNDPSVGCGATGPTTSPSLPIYGGYDTSNALLALGPRSLAMTPTASCTISNTQFSASLTFTPQLSVKF